MAERASIDLKDDLRQASIVCRYEILKFFSGKKIFIYLALVVLVFGLLTFVSFAFGDGTPDVKDETSSFFSFVTLFLLVGATLFSSVTLVSEFEERTAFTLFTKPVHKTAIFAGKFAAAYILNIGVMAIYTILVVIEAAVRTGGFAAEIFQAFGYCMCYAFALTGIAIFFSALMKRSSSASILTFIVILLVPSLIASIILIAGLAESLDDFWYVLDMAANSMLNCFNGPLKYGYRDILVMLAWGIVPAAAALLIFRRREV